jgi:hypothetical protein
MDNVTEDKKHTIPKWLKELQENSWELELLISGGAIFTLFQVSDVWINWLENMNIISFLPGRPFFLLLGTLGLETLKLGFILHLILRAFWLSMVCINYVFPSGINKEKIKWKKPFRINIEEKEDLQSPIIFVDRLCGIVMYLSIISTFLLSGIIFTIFITISAPMILGFNTGIFGVVLLFAFVAYLFDLVFGGILRKIPYLSHLTFPFFTLYDYLTFRKIYQKSALLFYTNISKWKFAMSALVFFTIALTFSYLNTYKIMHWPNIFDQREYRYQMTDNEIELIYSHYKDEIPEGKFPTIHIQSKIIKENYLELFIQYRIMFDELVELLPEKSEEKFLTDIFEISINDSVYSNIEWFRTFNKTTTNTGITAIIPIEDLKDGKHIIKLSCSDKIKAKSSEILFFELKCRNIYIPFWKDTEVTISK